MDLHRLIRRDTLVHMQKIALVELRTQAHNYLYLIVTFWKAPTGTFYGAKPIIDGVFAQCE